MNLKDFATELTAANRFVKACFGGFAGAGKSKTASDFVIGAYKDLGCTKPVLIIDNEKGSRFLIPKFRAAGIPVMVKDTTNVADVNAAIDFLRSGDIDFLFIDTLTKVYYQYVRDYKTKNKRTFMELSDWGKILPAWQEEFSDRFVAAQGSIIFTGRGGFSYEKEEDTVDEVTGRKKKGQFVKSGVKMKLAGETPFEPDLNIWMELEQEVGSDGLTVWREAQIMKDRSGLIDGKTFKNPTYEHFQPVIRYLMDVPVGPVAGQSSNANVAPSENWDAENRRQQRAILLEKIQAQFSKHQVSGQTKEGRAKIVNMLEKHFKTMAWKELEVTPLETLQQGFAAFEAEMNPPAPTPDPTLAIGVITDPQKRRLEALIGEYGLNRESVKDYCRKAYQKEHFADLTPSEYTDLEETLKDMKDAAATPA